MFLTLLRDNPFVNAAGRTVIKLAGKLKLPVSWLMNRYRVFGTVSLRVGQVTFRAYSQGDDHIVNELYYGLPYETEEFRLLNALLPRSAHFIDIGANTGVFTLFGAAINPALEISSFEPHPANLARLKKNLSINNLTNVSVNPIALGDVENSIRFNIPEDESISTVASANVAFSQNFHPIAFKAITVSQKRLDDVLQFDLTSRDVIKIDVEYYELNVLKGARKVLTTSSPIVVMEVFQYADLIEKFPGLKEKIQPDHAQQIERLMRDCGYSMYALGTDGIKRTESLLQIRQQRNVVFAPKLFVKPHYSFKQLAAMHD